MDINNLLIHLQHTNWQDVIRNYHSRHHLWEVAKVIVPAFITGMITIMVMIGIEHKNKKRWLNEGHLKRKVELEIQIRKFLLGIKGNIPDEYYALADRENEETTSNADFNKDFETLLNYLKIEEEQRGPNIYEDKSIFALMDEYVCYVPKIRSLFDEFKTIGAEILKNPENIKDKANIYLCFQDVVKRILKKITITRLK